jgi:hypothetical protein
VTVWRVDLGFGVPPLRLVLDSTDERLSLLVEQAALRAGVDLLRLDPDDVVAEALDRIARLRDTAPVPDR